MPATTQSSTHLEFPQKRLLFWGCLGVLLLVALILRVHDISLRSIDADEFQVTRTLNTPSLLICLKSILFWAPDNLPTFFAAQYLWGQTFGATVWATQSLSVLVGIMCVFLVAILGRRVVGEKAALLAAALTAISPIHIWFSQSLRPNATTEMLALLSILTLVLASDKSTRTRWILYLATNLLLVWNHPMAGLLLGAEMCWLFLLGWAHHHIPFRILIVNVMIMCSPFVYLSFFAPLIPTSDDDFFVAFPGLYSILVDLFADDAVISSEPFLFQPGNWAFLPNFVRPFISNNPHLFDILLLCLFVGPILFFSLKIVLDLIRRGSAKWREFVETHQYTLLLLFVVILPVAVLLTVSAAWRPVFQPRYTSYASFCVYLLLGMFIFQFRKPAIRYALLGCTVILCGYQLFVALNCTPFTDWRGAYGHIESRIQPEDIVLVKGTIYARDNLMANITSSPRNPIIPAYTLQSIAESGETFLASAPGTPRVWAMIEFFVFPPPPLERLEASLSARGLDFRRSDFPGMNGVYVYEISKRPANITPSAAAPDCFKEDYDFDALLANLGITQDMPEYAESLRIVKHTVDTPWPVSRLFSVFLSFMFAADGHAELAERAALSAVTFGPDYPLAHFAHAIALAEKGDWDGSRAALERAIALDPFAYIIEYKRMFECLYREKDMDAAQSELKRMEDYGLFVPIVFRVRAGALTLPANIKGFSGV